MAELIEIPLKKSSDVDIIKPLKNLIQATYSDSNEDFNDAINELSRLRSNAIWKVYEKSSLDALYRYYHWMSHIRSLNYFIIDINLEIMHNYSYI